MGLCFCGVFGALFRVLRLQCCFLGCFCEAFELFFGAKIVFGWQSCGKIMFLRECLYAKVGCCRLWIGWSKCVVCFGVAAPSGLREERGGRAGVAADLCGCVRRF